MLIWIGTNKNRGTIMDKHKEYFTIKELSSVFGISRQALSKHLHKLENEYISKNSKGYTVISKVGATCLAEKIGKKELLDGWLELQDSSNSNEKEALNDKNSIVVNGLLEQLSIKDEQISKLQSLLDQQQQLQLNIQQQLEEKNRLLELKNTEIEKFQLKKWYQFWK